ncbi:Aspartic protease pepB [Beauveria bassiana]|uniref:Endothiapepsin-like protein n=1 Tax=Beauveria bassiana (strain ARSEF 2860) TaxID=655819 RepID=J5K1S9_BEAB2|nr:endothiapepsin-like protein [Beauveria bassiana ARSEF 2860]EJP68136.1 endothiapepsin-like protein [Beauveria bassiana ARSEF 2860]KAF1729780.1 Aspartic protease pepB [Beauveria bassiana]KAH8713723.1 Penicillopepsin-3 [Beauveria bassiana]
MQTFGSFLVAALAAGFVSGSVTSSKSGTFELKQTGMPKWNLRNGPQALANAYSKYGKVVPDHVALAAANQNANKKKKKKHFKRGRGSVTAEPIMDDLEYLVNVHVGHNNQFMRLDLDTGSSDLWVFSTETIDAGAQNKYSPKRSSTAKKMHGAHWKISYGDGSSCSGDVYTDHVTIGGLTVQNQAVESAREVSRQFARGKGDGLLGLAFSSLNTVKPHKQNTWFDNVKPQLDDPVFVADLRHKVPGTYFFGFIPDTVRDVSYVDVDSSDGFWGFNASTSFGEVQGIADTGTTLLLLDDKTVEGYYADVKSAENDQQQGGFVFDCAETLPNFSFSVGGGNITIPGELINYAQASDSKCFGGIQAAGNIPFSIFGDVALKAAHVVFDAGNNRLGWAQKK